MSKPRLLDLFCGGGGAAMGYYRAGFEVIGVDIKPQPHYPFAFIQADAIEFLRARTGMFVDSVMRFDAIHASPPCQPFTRAGHLMRAQGHTTSKPDLVDPTRSLLAESGLPWVMENVPGSPIRNPLMLCGSMFGLRVQRHRLFESNVLLQSPGPCRHREQGRPVGVYHVMNDHVPQGGTTAKTLEEGQEAMGIDWMTWNELKEAIPPAYTEFIGRQLLNAIEKGSAA